LAVTALDPGGGKKGSGCRKSNVKKQSPEKKGRESQQVTYDKGGGGLGKDPKGGGGLNRRQTRETNELR